LQISALSDVLVSMRLNWLDVCTISTVYALMAFIPKPSYCSGEQTNLIH
jgi:hypothetical protein